MSAIEFRLKEALEDGTTFEYNLIVDGAVVGMCQLRTKPSKAKILPDGFESHLYYEIWPEFQGKGYGRKLF